MIFFGEGLEQVRERQAMQEAVGFVAACFQTIRWLRYGNSCGARLPTLAGNPGGGENSLRSLPETGFESKRLLSETQAGFGFARSPIFPTRLLSIPKFVWHYRSHSHPQQHVAHFRNRIHILTAR